MHTSVAISEIKNRAEAIGMTLSGLARKAGIHPSTAQRLAKGETHHGWRTTHEALVGALVAEEDRLREHLTKSVPGGAA